MNKKKVINPKIGLILARLRAKPVKYVPTVYATSDKESAKKVLDKLLAKSISPIRSEVSSIKIVPREIGEGRDGV